MIPFYHVVGNNREIPLGNIERAAWSYDLLFLTSYSKVRFLSVHILGRHLELGLFEMADARGRCAFSLSRLSVENFRLT